LPYADAVSNKGISDRHITSAKVKDNAFFMFFSSKNFILFF